MYRCSYLILGSHHMLMIYLYFLFKGPICLTKATSSDKNPDPNKICILPFKWEDQVYGKCAKYRSKNGQEDYFWCATEVGSDGKYVPHSDKWGVCSDGCPKEGKKCKTTVAIANRA